MCDKSNSNFSSKMLYYMSYCIAVIIVVSISFVKFSFWTLKLLSISFPKVLFRMGCAIVIEGLKMKYNAPNQNDNISDADSDNGYVTAEEETLDEFHDSHQYVRWELPPNAIKFYPLSSLFALHGIPYKLKSSPVDNVHLYYSPPMLFESTNEQKRKKRKPKKTWKKRVTRAFKRKRVPSPLVDDSNTPHHPEKQIIDISSKLTIITDEISVQEIANKWICPLPKDNSKTPNDPEKQKTEECLESKDNLEHEIKDDMTTSSELTDQRVNETCHDPEKQKTEECLESKDNLEHEIKDDMTTSSELTDQRVVTSHDSQKTWKQRLLNGIFRKRVSRSTNDDSHSTEKRIRRHKSKLTWKQRFICCMSTKTDD